MGEFNEEGVRRLVEDLDRAVPRDGAKVRLKQYGGGPDESKIVANRLGYLRLGLELMKGAFAQPKKADDPSLVDVDIRYLLTRDSMMDLDWFERREDIPQGEKSPRLKGGRFARLTVFVLLLLCVVLLFIGCVTVLTWIFGK
jgi:hypothetical protein